jgi:hypothetical protein
MNRLLPALIAGVLTFFFLGVPAAFASVVINEFMPNPAGSDTGEWVEFYNTSSSSADLSDYFFDDDTSFDTDGGSAIIVLSGILPGASTCFWELSSYLNNTGDSPTLFAAGGETVDSYSYTATQDDKTFARVPDGGSWQQDQSPTKSPVRCLDLAPSPTPTPSPTNTPTPTPTTAPSTTATSTPKPTSSLTVTKTPILKPSVALSPTQEATESDAGGETALVLGETTGEATPSSREGVRAFAISFTFIGLGFGLLSGVMLWKKKDTLKSLLPKHS